MKCADNGTLQTYLDSELATSAVRDLTEHLGECQRCQSRLAELRAAAESLRNSLQELNPEDIDIPKWDAPTLTTSASQPAQSTPTTHLRRTLSGWLRPLTAVAAGFVLTFWTYQYFSSVPPIELHCEASEWPPPQVTTDPNRMWHERSLIITVVDHSAGTMERIVTSNRDGGTTQETFQLPSIGPSPSSGEEPKGT